MSLADLIEKGSLRGLATATPATVTTIKAYTRPSVATVATVAVAIAPVSAKNDAPDRLRAASLALDALILASGLAADPDRWCWPHSTAMNTAETETFTARLSRFTDKGLIFDDAESLVDKLVRRDREGDDRALCMECQHLSDSFTGNWRCGARRHGSTVNLAGDTRLPGELVARLQRCDSFVSPQGTGPPKMEITDPGRNATEANSEA